MPVHYTLLPLDLTLSVGLFSFIFWLKRFVNIFIVDYCITDESPMVLLDGGDPYLPPNDIQGIRELSIFVRKRNEK